VKITRHLVISGRVQGVYYRESMRLEADRLGVSGWVRNRREGTVEAMVHAESEQVDAIIAWAWQGPTAAEVEHVEVKDGTGEFATFERLPTF
jgi:acylphosphatase